MAYQGVIDDIRKCIQLEKPTRIPVFALSEEFDVRVCGMVYEDFATNAQNMAQCQIQVIERFDYDWAWLQVDDCFEFEVLGVGVKGGGNILYATCDYLPATADTLKQLKMPDPQKDGRMPILLEAISTLRAHFGDTICITGRTAAPFSSVMLLYGLEVGTMLCYNDEKLLRDTMDFFVELQAEWGKAQYEAGAHALWVGDCNASTHLISPNFYRDFAFEPAQRLLEAYQQMDIITLYHASEEGGSLPIMVELGADVLSPGPGIDMVEVIEMARGKVCVAGNIDPIAVLERGTVEEIERETARLINAGKKAGGYIFNSGEMIPRDTPIENIEAMMKVAKRG